jgi:hypothetical protein
MTSAIPFEGQSLMTGIQIKYITIMSFALTGLQISPSFGADFMTVSPGEKAGFKEIFLQWQKDQIVKRHYMEKEDCSISFYVDRFIEDKYPPNVGLGFPEELDAIIPVFANEDDVVDFVGAFQPIQCDGGNATRGMQMQILFLSSENGYIADSEFLFKNIKQPPEPVAFYRDALLGSRDKKILIGEAIVGKLGDPYCCFSLKYKFTFDFKTGETIFEDAIEGEW